MLNFKLIDFATRRTAGNVVMDYVPYIGSTIVFNTKYNLDRFKVVDVEYILDTESQNKETQIIVTKLPTAQDF
jgi:hypothetical protein